ncbi:MAG: phenylalanine--tRNA ligase subunit alpha [Alphaproteobacteria bacterium]|nr:phenylalanine--tRNA ligase subunit alpha [Alphaproteobacteria bacterium]MBR6685178.1 phenylalanine--tRNA ligase subunit alpha [Alphaproteobacteria bacterium]
MQEQIKNINTLEELQALYTATFGKNGTMTARLKEMKNLDNDARAALNLENQALRELFKVRQTEIENAVLMAGLQKQKLDVSLNPLPENRGTLHPLTQSFKEVVNIFESLGYTYMTGPEIEDDWHNFTALNTPLHHPARDMQDTFFLTNGNVMRTQTSAVQIRAMEKNGVPIKMFTVGQCYRKELDATHSAMFGQIEGLYIDTIEKGVNLSDMLATMRTFASKYFEKDDLELRIRPSYFPFTDPSIEIDMKFGDKWMELLCGGMVHPNVLKNCNINPDKYQGFAFGFGWARLVMIKYGLNDIRAFTDSDVRWLKNSGF